MAWSEQWSYFVDGDSAKQLNSLATGGHFMCEIPEWDWMQEQTMRMVARDLDYPALVGMQPEAGNFTLLIQMTPCDWPTYDARVTQLKGWLPYGAHTITGQVRGQASAKTLTTVVRSAVTNPKQRSITFLTTAPKPVLV